VVREKTPEPGDNNQIPKGERPMEELDFEIPEEILREIEEDEIVER